MIKIIKIKSLITQIAILLFIILSKFTIYAEYAKPKIFINQLVRHKALDVTTQGIKDGLKERGYLENINLDLKVEFAQGDVVLSNQIASKFVNQNPDIVVGVGTIASQSFLKYTESAKAKLVFTTVTDPLAAGLVNSLKEPGGNVSGVSNFVPLEPQIEMFKRIKPSIRKLGFLYNPGELNSISLIKKLEEICPKYDIELITISAINTSKVSQNAIKLASMVDAIFVSNDNTALSAITVILKAANAENIPVFVSDTDIVKEGAVAALGPNQYEIGKQTASMIIKIIEGREIGNIPVYFPEKMELVLNKTAANKLGIKLSKKIISEAEDLF